MWDKQTEAQTIWQPAKKSGRQSEKTQDPLLLVQLLLCVAAVAFAILAKSMDAGFLPQLSQAMDTVLSQGVDFSQENTFAHFAGGMVNGLRESARQVMAQLDGAAQTASSAPAQGGYLPVQKNETPPEGFSMDAYVPKQPLYSPVQGTLTSGYGYRDNPVNGQEDFHAGLDIAVAEGTPVHCAQDGQVVQAGFNSIRGNYIIVRHTDGLQTLYQHLACGFVRAGEGVTRGQVIASAGSTGMSTGAHLHFELIYNGVRYDPSAALLAS